MNPKHHPGAALILAYASGSLSEGLGLVVASHMSLCKQCQENVRDAEMIGGAFLEEMAPKKIKNDILDNILNQIDAIAQEEPVFSYQSDDPEIPQPLCDYLNSPLDDLNWKFLAPGLRHIPVSAKAGKNGTVRMFKIAPGTTLPVHTHSGTELSLVLRGSYCDELGRFQPGDIADVDQFDIHQPIADTDQDCICLITTEGPTVFQGFLNRMLQPLFGI